MAEKNILCEMVCADALPKVICDSEKINQVFVNLLSNAIKFSPEGKKIKLQILLETLPQPPFFGVPCVTVSVSDEGVGIPESELESVFDEFVQSSKTKSSAGGTGLGLAISKRIIDGHSGVIKAGNNETGGAIFTFSIPIEGVH